MGTITYDGYWTGTYDQEKHEFRVDTFVAAPTTITFSGESLIPGQQLTDPSLYYFGYADALGEPDLLAAASGNTLPVRMYSNITTLKKGERVPTQAANWPCLLAGTLVATPVGAVPVESLRPGDQVLTPEGDAVTIGDHSVRGSGCGAGRHSRRRPHGRGSVDRPLRLAGSRRPDRRSARERSGARQRIVDHDSG
jgi:hypothetical protein